MIENDIEVSASLFRRVVYEQAYSDKLFSAIGAGDKKCSVDFVKFAVIGVLKDFFFIERIIKERGYFDLSSKKINDEFKSLVFVSLFLLKNSTLVKEIVASVAVEVCKRIVNLQAAKMMNAILRRVLREGLYERDYQYLKERVFYFQKLSKDEDCDKIIQAIYDHSGEAPGGYFVDLADSVGLEDFEESNLSPGYYYVKNYNKEKSYRGFVFQDIANHLLMNFFLGELNCTGKKKIFETCAYPGGKSFRLKIFFENSVVVHNDVLQGKSHQLKKRLSSGVFTTSDASQTPFKDNSFDYVFADVPCSGSGVVKKKPEIILTINQKRLNSLLDTQRKILKEASRIVKIGGKIFYSTCSLFSCENEEQINSFLRENKNFILVGRGVDSLASGGGFFFNSLRLPQFSNGIFGAAIEKRS